MQLIKSLRSFGRWLFNIKDEVKQDYDINPKDLFQDIFDGRIVYIICVKNGVVTYRAEASVRRLKLSVDMFFDHHRKIS